MPSAPHRNNAEGMTMDEQIRLRSKLYSLLGDLPPRDRPIQMTSLGSETRDAYKLERLILDLNGTELVPAYYIRPTAVATGQPLPAILYNHWHGGDYALGKDGFIHGMAGHAAAGLRPWADELAALGCAALCIDHWCFGERSGRKESATFKEMLWRGQTLWGHMVYDNLRALDWLAARPDVDCRRLGTLGMSMGSTMAWWLAALDPRVSVCVDICCLTEFEAILRSGNIDFHGVYYFVPGLLKEFSAAQINALIAPRPHLSLAGNLDEMTPAEGLDRIDRELRAVYGKAGAAECWRLFRQDVKHVETVEMRREIQRFLRRHLSLVAGNGVEDRCRS